MTDTNIPSNSDDGPLRPKPVVLLLIDGWGIAPASEANAFATVDTPVFFNLTKDYPVAALDVMNLKLNDRYLVLGSGQSEVSEGYYPEHPLSKIISEAGLKQIKITESERLAALTYFFNGRHDDRATGEECRILSSDIDDYKTQGRLSVLRLVRETVKAINSENFDFIVTAIPTLDLAATTGDSEAINSVISALDKSFKKIVQATLDKKGAVIIAAAAGNAEKIKNLNSDMPDTDMTNNPVPLVIIEENLKGQTIGLDEPLNNDLSLLKPAGTLADLAPTILQIMKLNKPSEMTGESLI